MSDKVVFLAFKNERLEPDGPLFESCKVCRNKTFVLVSESEDSFAICQCAVCRNRIGRIGWAED